MNQESDFGVQVAEGGEGGERDLHEVADAADVDEDLIRALVSETSAQLAYHRRRVFSTEAGVSTRAAVAGTNRGDWPVRYSWRWEKAAGSARMMACILDIFGGWNRNTYGDEV